jgi:tetratricopeptide (TPR) repeat protein
VRSATTSLTATAVAILLVVSCARQPASRPAVSPQLSPEIIHARLAEADALAARGCYLCLLEASSAYENLAQVSSSVDAVRKALETDLMLAVRESELQIPDSGARARAEMLRLRAGANYDAHFALLAGPATRDATLAELAGLETRWPTEPVSAYFYLAFSLQAGRWNRADLATEPQKIAATHPENAALQYRIGAFQPTYDSARMSALLDAEPRFAEIRLIRGQRALFGGGLVTARTEFVAAHDTLPQSLAIKSALATVEFAYARYAPALKLFDEILTIGPNPSAQLGRAQALSYLHRHREAITELDELLKDPSRSPGDKYYWRAWNKLQLAELRPAYDDATTALNFMNGPDVFRLAGIATFNLEVLPEARVYFESALKMFAADCDSIQYIGQLDAAERKWAAAVASFTKAAGCFQESMARMAEDLARKEAANTDGLMDHLVAGLRSDIEARRLLHEQSLRNAEAAAKNIPPAGRPSR